MLFNKHLSKITASVLIYLVHYFSIYSRWKNFLNSKPIVILHLNACYCLQSTHFEELYPNFIAAAFFPKELEILLVMALVRWFMEKPGWLFDEHSCSKLRKMSFLHSIWQQQVKHCPGLSQKFTWSPCSMSPSRGDHSFQMEMLKF